WLISDVVRKGLKLYLEWSARLKGQRFYCRALGGQSEYNITINCDLTVSCNCQDYNGSGHLGDLNKNSFSEVFFGPAAQHLLSENTVRCNIDCLGCDRESAARIRTTKQMELDKLSRMADLVSELGLRELFYLNLGEPFLSPNIGKELPLLRQKNPDCRIVISTNAIILNTDAKREAAMYASHIFFSIAGINDAMLKKYEHGGNFDKAYENLKAIVAYR